MKNFAMTNSTILLRMTRVNVVENSIFRGFIPPSSYEQARQADCETGRNWRLNGVLSIKTTKNDQTWYIFRISSKSLFDWAMRGMNPLNIEFLTARTLRMTQMIWDSYIKLWLDIWSKKNSIHAYRSIELGFTNGSGKLSANTALILWHNYHNAWNNP